MAKNIYGGGTQTNLNGLKFEQETDLKESFKNSGFEIEKLPQMKINGKKDRSYEVYKISLDGTLYGYVMQKHNLYRYFGLKEKVLDETGNECEKWEKIISRQLLPDDAFYNINDHKLYIIEKKFQNGNGSVDEKLQTSGFKLYEYNKLFAENEEIQDINFYYLLNNFYSNGKYKDVIEYIRKDDHCKVYFNVLPLESLGIHTKNE